MTSDKREEVIKSIKDRKVKVIGKPRKKFSRDAIDKESLRYMYEDMVLPVQEIADKYNKTRQRIWQLLVEYGLHNKSRLVRVCMNPECGKSFEVVRSRVRNGPAKYCPDSNCYQDHRLSLGYDPCKQGQRRGRKVIEKWLGFKLPTEFVVHHDDGNQGHNFKENLFVFSSNSEHMKYHHAKRNGGGELPYKELWELPGKIEEWLLEGVA